MKKNLIYLSYTVFLLITIICSCKKPEVGYISNNLNYSPQLLIVPQGITMYSNAINTDQSTQPLKVKLLAIRNKLTGKPAPDMLKLDTINTFSGEITDADSTLALLNAKITKSLKQPFNVNPLGGRLEFSTATSNVDSGLYTIDVEVSNLRGSKTLLNACDIQLVAKINSSIGSTFSSYSDVEAETNFTTLPNPVASIERTAGPNKVIIKVVDKNGIPFNPAAGQVINRGDRGNYAQMNPYYPVVKTTTGMEWGFPVLPNGFPIKLGANGTLCYYRVPGAYNTLNKNVNLTFDAFKVFSPGTYTLTITLPTITKK
ncbi:DUF5007 domain-containing protein [Mucilaginibacter sp. SP1R1]|uniref:DUF5007 domain-containing protein n=1 Tax=Mucilaginibacter sp. SP1R1 TaxID=2723091 RepID=UPI00160A5158|nr:DUF5007 domain-containing protein [Mucilaginibacter sp. SP1R1]MBB6148527.1 hypothetical protein [Mucilaginibacter sp. SP1R1]